MNSFEIGDRVQWNKNGSEPCNNRLIPGPVGQVNAPLDWRLAAGDQGVVIQLMSTFAVIVRFDKYPLDEVVIRINEGPKPVGFLTKAQCTK